MSAFILAKKHIDTLVEAALFTCRNSRKGFGFIHNGDYKVINDGDNIGQILVNQNYSSVNYRYNENKNPYEYHMEEIPLTISMRPIQILKACDCYDYQSCETIDYYTTEAYAIVDGIRKNIIHKLPGYDKAEWDIA